MALRKWSIIEEELKKTGTVHPLLLRCLGEMHERHRVQHEQMMQVVTVISELQDKFIDVVNGFGNVNTTLKKLGLTRAGEKISELEGDPDETGSTWHDMRDVKKN